MAGRRAILVSILGVILVACSAGMEPTSSPRASPTTSQVEPSPPAVTSSPTPVVTPTPPSEATPAATSTPTPDPTSTPRPAPPKPTGVDYSRCCGEGSWEPESGVSWKTPRTKGVEIRVYGVTVCIPTEDGSDDLCLRKGTLLPSDIRVLLAKAPASKGTVSWYQDEDDDEADLCAGAMVDKDGTRYYSVVVQAFGPTGRSTFAIADEGWYDSEECASYVVQKGESLAMIAQRYGLAVDDLIAANLSTLPDPNRLRVGSTILIPSSWLVED